MRFYVRCDICNKEFHCEGLKLPKDITLVDGLDMCTNCFREYCKRIKRLKEELQKERWIKPSQRTGRENYLNNKNDKGGIENGKI